MSAKRIVNARKLAASRSELQGTVQIQSLTGAHDRLADTGGELEYTLAFQYSGSDQDSLPQVNVELQAEVNLLCQRQLQPFTQQVSAESQVVLVADEAQAEQVVEHYEPFACSDIELDIEALLAEELLLALPLVAIDPAAERLQTTVDEQTGAGEQDDHPFAGLAALKQKLAAKKD